MQLTTALRYLLIPLRLNGLLLVAALSVGYWIAGLAGLFGLPLIVMLSSWLFKYSYVLLEYVANGRREAPVLSYEMINPFGEQRPWAQLVIIVLAGSLVGLAGQWLGPVAALVLGLLGLLLLPASVAVLGIEGSLLRAMDPRALWEMVRSLHTAYALIVLAALALAAGVAGLDALSVVPVIVRHALALAGWLALFSLIGGAVHEAREALGFEPVESAERRLAGAERERERLYQQTFDLAYGAMRSSNWHNAWSVLEQSLAAAPDERALTDWLLARLTALTAPSAARLLADRLAQRAVGKALGADNGRALSIAAARLAVSATFRPLSAAQTLRVADLARLAGQPRVARDLLAQFAEHFPGDAAALRASETLQRLVAGH